DGRRLRYLLHFGFDGLVGMETRAEAEELAGLEASLEVECGDGVVPYRAVVIEQANEVDGGRRAALEDARNAVLEERLNPIYRTALERAHEMCREFGWASYAAAYAELRGIDLERLRAQTAELLAATDDAYGLRQLGDNSVTESFAFLVEHLVSDPVWLRQRLGIADPAPAVEHSRAFPLVMLRRYSAKLAYELDLHGAAAELARMPDRYAE